MQSKAQLRALAFMDFVLPFFVVATESWDVGARRLSLLRLVVGAEERTQLGTEELDFVPVFFKFLFFFFVFLGSIDLRSSEGVVAGLCSCYFLWFLDL